MPLYEYRCNDCGKVFEKIVGFSETNHIAICPECQSQNTLKKISKVAALGASISGNSSSASSNCGASGGFS